MKLLPLFLLLLISGSTFSQVKKTYYDWEWQETDASHARFGSVTKHTDSGWIRQDIFVNSGKPQMIGLFADSMTKIRNGWFTYYYSGGGISSTGALVNGKKNGLWLSYHHNGQLKDSGVYSKSFPTGTLLSWHANGRLSDSMVVSDYDKRISVTRWFSNGNVSETGTLGSNGKRDQQWKFYHTNNHLASVEDYENGELIKAIYYDENDQPVTDTAGKIKVPAKFGSGDKAWKKYLLKNAMFPEGVKIKNTTEVTVLASALIDEEGNLTDIHIDIPFHEKFDTIALDILKNAPKWKPALLHGRRIAYIIRQPITFVQN